MHRNGDTGDVVARMAIQLRQRFLRRQALGLDEEAAQVRLARDPVRVRDAQVP